MRVCGVCVCEESACELRAGALRARARPPRSPTPSHTRRSHARPRGAHALALSGDRCAKAEAWRRVGVACGRGVRAWRGARAGAAVEVQEKLRLINAPLAAFCRDRAAAASCGEMLEASTPPLSSGMSSKSSGVLQGLTYTA